jgi:hypothetical protein
VITLALFALATVNLLTKKTATVSGLGFASAFFATFELSERYNRKRNIRPPKALEKFHLETRNDVSLDALRARPGNILVAVRHPDRLEHLSAVLEETDTQKTDIIAVAVHRVTAAGSGEHDLKAEQIFGASEVELFTAVVALAEKAGKHVELLVVPASDPSIAIIQTARELGSARVVTRLSPRMDAFRQAKVFGDAWERLPVPRPPLSLVIVLPNGQSRVFHLGPHQTQLWPADVELVHRLWRELTQRGIGGELHHRDVVGVALGLLERQLHSPQAGEVLKAIERELARRRSSGVARNSDMNRELSMTTHGQDGHILPQASSGASREPPGP